MIDKIKNIRFIMFLGAIILVTYTCQEKKQLSSCLKNNFSLINLNLESDSIVTVLSDSGTPIPNVVKNYCDEKEMFQQFLNYWDEFYNCLTDSCLLNSYFHDSIELKGVSDYDTIKKISYKSIYIILHNKQIILNETFFEHNQYGTFSCDWARLGDFNFIKDTSQNWKLYMVYI